MNATAPHTPQQMRNAFPALTPEEAAALEEYITESDWADTPMSPADYRLYRGDVTATDLPTHTDLIHLRNGMDYTHLHYTAPGGRRMIDITSCLTHAYRHHVAVFTADNTPGAAAYQRDNGWAAYRGMRIVITGFTDRGPNGVHMTGHVDDIDTLAHGEYIQVPLANMAIYAEDSR
jgi:hypothetical protein